MHKTMYISSSVAEQINNKSIHVFIQIRCLLIHRYHDRNMVNVMVISYSKRSLEQFCANVQKLGIFQQEHYKLMSNWNLMTLQSMHNIHSYYYKMTLKGIKLQTKKQSFIH